MSVQINLKKSMPRHNLAMLQMSDRTRETTTTAAARNIQPPPPPPPASLLP